MPEPEKELDLSSEIISRAINSYIADDDPESMLRPPVYCPDLGLAVEELKEGFTMQDLWEVLPLSEFVQKQNAEMIANNIP